MAEDVGSIGVRLSEQTEAEVSSRLEKFLAARTEMPLVPAIDATLIILRSYGVSFHAARQDARDRVRKRSKKPQEKTMRRKSYSRPQDHNGYNYH